MGAPRTEPLPTQLRPWLTLRSGRACTRRTITQTAPLASEEVLAFATMPLSPIDLSATVATHTRAQRGLPSPPSSLPFDLSRHPAVQSELAHSMLKRLENDVRGYAASENTAEVPMLAGFTRAEIAQCLGSSRYTAALLSRAKHLAERLTSLQRRDTSRSP